MIISHVYWGDIMKKIHKVTHLRFFDFLDSFYAYGLRKNKNDFGYMVKTDYYYGDKKYFREDYIIMLGIKNFIIMDLVLIYLNYLL